LIGVFLLYRHIVLHVAQPVVVVVGERGFDFEWRVTAVATVLYLAFGPMVAHMYRRKLGMLKRPNAGVVAVDKERVCMT